MNQTLLEFINTLDASMKRFQAANNTAFSKLSVHQLQYLETIATLNSPTISEIAENMGFTRPSVTEAIKKLVHLGYVKKSRSAEDRRVVFVELTESGEHFKIAKEHTLLYYESFIENTLNMEEREQFERILQKLVTSFRHLDNHQGQQR